MDMTKRIGVFATTQTYQKGEVWILLICAKSVVEGEFKGEFEISIWKQLVPFERPAYFVTTVKSILRGGNQLFVLFPDLRPENSLKRIFQHVEEFNEFVTAKLNAGPLQVFGDYF